MFTRQEKLEWTPKPSGWKIRTPLALLVGLLFLTAGLTNAAPVAPLTQVFNIYCRDNRINQELPLPSYLPKGNAIVHFYGEDRTEVINQVAKYYNQSRNTDDLAYRREMDSCMIAPVITGQPLSDEEHLLIRPRNRR